MTLVGGYADNTVDLCGEGNADAKRPCLDKGQTILTKQPSQAEFEECWSETRFRVIAESLPPNEQIPGGTEPKKYGETRYGSRVTLSERMIKTRRINEKLMLDQEYMSWLDRQGAKTKDKVRM